MSIAPSGNGTPAGRASGYRTAFQRLLVHDHKALGTAISAVALSSCGERLYCGLTDGQLEEFKVYSDFSTARVSISARKFVGKKVCVCVRG